MPQFQNYFPNNGYVPQMQNPYMDRLQGLQQFQQAIQAPSMTALGNIVESIKVVETMNIPMDGNMYYFPKADGTEIYGKQWLANGTTHTIVFKPVLEPQTDNSKAYDEKLNFGAFRELVEGIRQDVITLNDKIDKLNKPTRTKKESLDE